MKVLLSIRPEYVKKIFEGTKKFEYRKCQFKRAGIKTVVVYCTHPVARIVGEFEVIDIVCDLPENVWNSTQDHSGIDRKFFEDYYFGRDTAVAIRIGSTTLYDSPLDPQDVFERFVPPQSFRYLSETLACSILKEQPR